MGVRRLALLALLLAVAAPAQAAPVVRLTIVHVMRGCHVFALGTKDVGASPTITVARGTTVTLRVNCPMDFDLAGRGTTTRLYAGTTTKLSFPRRGTFVFTGRNIQAPEDVGLQVLGTVNVLTLRVRVI